jgi:4-diphosphocytidyl-2-C-methyl-D-erythritol kinase
MPLRLCAFAKINLTLDVFSKRPDGFHGIASVMQAISLHDTLQFECRAEPGIGFTCDGPEAQGVPINEENLVVRAAVRALESSPNAGGLSIHLSKHVPSQAGLGGGSSDAAAALIGVNRLLGLNLTEARMHKIAAELGSDVPFFLIGGTAVARGRGEKLTGLADAPPIWIVLVKPDENVSTGLAYNELDNLPDRSSHRGTKRMEQAISENNRELVVSRTCNDFELPVFSRHPTLAWLQDELVMAGATNARLCGSGSALFGVAASETEAARIASSLRSKYPRVYTARTLTRSESYQYLNMPIANAGDNT